MILSSADILRVLGGSEIIRLAAKVKIVDGKPSLTGAEGLYICIDRFPRVEEFQATWFLYIESDGSEPEDLVLAEIQKLLPSVKVKPGLMTTVTTTDFLSENTQRPQGEPKPAKAQVDLSQYEERFQSLVEDVEDRMLLVSSGRNGKDGKDGRDGYDGRDGKDIDATQTELFDLKDVDESPLPLEKGQVLTWDGSKWTNLYTRTVTSVSAGGGGGGGSSDVQVLNDLEDVTTEGVADGQFLQYSESTGQWQTVTIQPGSGVEEAPVDGQQYARQDATWTVVQATGGGGIEEAPMDGNFYVRQNGAWIDLKDALSQLGVPVDEPVDGGNFTTGFSAATTSTPADGGNFTTGDSIAEHGITLDGGNYSTGQTAADEFSAFGL